MWWIWIIYGTDDRTYSRPGFARWADLTVPLFSCARAHAPPDTFTPFMGTDAKENELGRMILAGRQAYKKTMKRL